MSSEKVTELPSAYEGDAPPSSTSKASYTDGEKAIRPVVTKVINTHTTELGFLTAYSIRLWFMEKPAMRKGTALVTTSKVFSAKERLYVEEDAELMVWKTAWDSADDVGKMAIIHNALCYFETNGERLKTVAPDFIGFCSNVRHYGPWTEELKKLLDASESYQMSLDDIEDEEAA